jgi:hypothetical protein
MRTRSGCRLAPAIRCSPVHGGKWLNALLSTKSAPPKAPFATQSSDLDHETKTQLTERALGILSTATTNVFSSAGCDPSKRQQNEHELFRSIQGLNEWSLSGIRPKAETCSTSSCVPARTGCMGPASEHRTRGQRSDPDAVRFTTIDTPAIRRPSMRPDHTRSRQKRHHGERSCQRVEQIDVGSNRAVRAGHLRVGRLDQPVLVGRVGTGAVAKPELARWQLERCPGECHARP